MAWATSVPAPPSDGANGSRPQGVTAWLSISFCCLTTPGWGSGTLPPRPAPTPAPFSGLFPSQLLFSFAARRRPLGACAERAELARSLSGALRPLSALEGAALGLLKASLGCLGGTVAIIRMS